MSSLGLALAALLVATACNGPAAAPAPSATAAAPAPATAALATTAAPSTPRPTAAPTAALARHLSFALTDVRTGERFTLGDFGGKVVLVQAMAVW